MSSRVNEPRRIEVLPVLGIPELRPGDDLAKLIAEQAPQLCDGDVLVVTSKAVSKVQPEKIVKRVQTQLRTATRAGAHWGTTVSARVRTWTERRGTPDLTEYGKLLRKDAAELDAFLDRVTINVSHL